MHRELMRKKQALPIEECAEILLSETRGVLAVNGDSGYPYAMPMNHFYFPEDGCIYFHSGKTGHRTDSLLRSDKVSFCVTEEGARKDGDWASTVRSVIVFGRVTLTDDPSEIRRILPLLSMKFTSDTEYVEREIAESGKRTLLLKLIPEHISGKRIREA